MITDSHGRTINYLRLAVTDKCNLRCTYCMPAVGLNWLPKAELMTTEEMLRISRLLITMGVEKIRITGGEPFVRKDLMPFLGELSKMLGHGLKEITLTTNGLLTEPYIPELKKLGIRSVNLSLDTLDRQRFIDITRRDALPQVLNTLEKLLLAGIAVKINTVVMEDCNTQDILPLVALTKSMPVSVRFIEEMPFNGGTHDISLSWNFSRIIEHIREQYPDLAKMQDPIHATALNYHIEGHQGDIGVIAAYTRSFCGSCNRLRITAKGGLRTCLYGQGVLNLKDLIRAGASDQVIEKQLLSAVLNKPLDGWEAEKNKTNNIIGQPSMATIGG